MSRVRPALHTRAIAPAGSQLGAVERSDREPRVDGWDVQASTPSPSPPVAHSPLATRFEQLSTTAAPGELQLLKGLDAGSMPRSAAERLVSVQEAHQQQRAVTARMTFSVDPRGIDASKGYESKLVLNAHDGGRFAGRYLFKRMAPDQAAKVE